MTAGMTLRAGRVVPRYYAGTRYYSRPGWVLRDGGEIRILIPMGFSATWAGRVFGYVCMATAIATADLRAHDVRMLVLQGAGYLSIGAVVVFWYVQTARAPRNAAPGRGLQWTLGFICAVAGLISASPHGTLAIILACIATVAAGGDVPLVPALSVTCSGILGVLLGLVLSHNANAGALIGLPVLIATGLVLGLQRRTYRVQAEQAAELLVRDRELQVQQRRADVLDERARIAREIHDVLAHSLGGLGIQIQAARAVLTDSADVDKALEVLGHAQKLASAGLTETRRAVHALRSDLLSLDEELRTLAADRGGLYHAEIRYEAEGEPYEIIPAAAMALLRIAQEAVVNAVKHAPGQPIDIRLSYQSERIALEAVNPLPSAAGTASDTQSTATSGLHTADTGLGLTGMRERLLLLGGALQAERVGDTWVVAARLPTIPVPRTTSTAPTEGHSE